MGAAGSMPLDSPHCTGSSPNSPDPSSLEPICPDPIAYLPPYVSDIRLAQPFSASSSTAPGRIPSLKELQEELEGQARMAAKVQEAENKRASKARIREGERGQWWPCETTDVELRELQNEGMISAHWSFIRDTDVPKPGAGEVVMTKAWVEHGLSLPCSEFFLSILNTYGLQPHNICPNAYLLLSNFATLCEEHLGIRPISILCRRKTFAPYFVSPLAAARRRFRKTKRRKRSRHPARRPLNLRSSSDHRRHPDHQPRTHYQIHEKVSGPPTRSAKHFPHCSTAVSSSG
ncbi:hypothetical protein QYE76_036191 [Lolium multiflorum]|uniref:Transposase (putative) gypsy type domain-containing protein n=1 Tax=Lolium multiflorum TaxID=4521 RepID=A0AAD8R0K0_LOLMU|nr:hypothetical protein QYE76_036191 [Lolium multiflorum]